MQLSGQNNNKNNELQTVFNTNDNKGYCQLHAFIKCTCKVHKSKKSLHCDLNLKTEQVCFHSTFKTVKAELDVVAPTEEHFTGAGRQQRNTAVCHRQAVKKCSVEVFHIYTSVPFSRASRKENTTSDIQCVPKSDPPHKFCTNPSYHLADFLFLQNVVKKFSYQQHYLLVSCVQ